MPFTPRAVEGRTPFTPRAIEGRVSPRRRWLPRLGLAALLLAIGAALFVRSLDDSLAARAPSHLLLDRHGRYLGEVPSTDDVLGYWPLPDALPEKIAVATLQIEDRHFREHAGVYLPSVARAIWQNARNRRVVSGASTIAMQVARLQHPAGRSLWAKAREAGEALLLVRRHGHDALLRQYLTLAPYGNRAHGAARAARLYFDKPAEDLSWLQAAFLAALPQQPGRMSPWADDGRERGLRRARRILRQLHQRGVITGDDLRLALASDLGLVPRPHRHPEAMHAVLAFSRELTRPGAPLIATSTLDLEIQEQAARAVKENLQRVRWANATNSAALVVDVGSGEVLGYVGSADYFDADARGAIDFLQARRSPGSALKPFIYALALEKGTHTAASELPDVPTEFDAFSGGAWAPENMTHTFLGPMLFRQALGNSRNIPALRLLSDVGLERALDLFERGGVRAIDRSPDRYGLGLAIGSFAVTPLELATLYTALANNGETRPLTHWASGHPGLSAPVHPETSRGAPPVHPERSRAPVHPERSRAPVHPERSRGARLLSRDAAQMTAHLLSDPEVRRPGFPAGGPLDFDYAVAVKTGTSQGYRDAWAVAFSDRLLVVVWVGNHDARKMNGVSGATGAAPAANRILEAVMPLRAPHLPVASAFAPPTHWVPAEICALSGRLPGPGCTHTKTEFFAPGSEPNESCPFHVEVALDTRNGLLAGPRCPAAHVIKRQLLALPGDYATWARRQRLEIAPTVESPLCPSAEPPPPKISITEPRALSRYLFDPDTPRELSTVRLAATVAPATEEIVWLVDGSPVAQVGWPHELRVPLTPGHHVIRAAFASREGQSAPITVMVDD